MVCIVCGGVYGVYYCLLVCIVCITVYWCVVVCTVYYCLLVCIVYGISTGGEAIHLSCYVKESFEPEEKHA